MRLNQSALGGEPQYTCHCDPAVLLTPARAKTCTLSESLAASNHGAAIVGKAATALRPDLKSLIYCQSMLTCTCGGAMVRRVLHGLTCRMAAFAMPSNLTSTRPDFAGRRPHAWRCSSVQWKAMVAAVPGNAAGCTSAPGAAVLPLSEELRVSDEASDVELILQQDCYNVALSMQA